jgi:hypothetical protein
MFTMVLLELCSWKLFKLNVTKFASFREWKMNLNMYQERTFLTTSWKKTDMFYLFYPVLLYSLTFEIIGEATKLLARD